MSKHLTAGESLPCYLPSTNTPTVQAFQNLPPQDLTKYMQTKEWFKFVEVV